LKKTVEDVRVGEPYVHLPYRIMQLKWNKYR